MNERLEKLSKKYYYDNLAVYGRGPDKKEQWGVVSWMEAMCQHVKGELSGKPLILSDFHKRDIFEPVFGLKKYKGGPRLISECYIEIPKKNAKTLVLAGTSLFLEFADGEEGAEIYNCAGDDEQAGLLFRTAKLMVERNSILSERAELLKSEIRFKDRIIKKVTSKAGTKHGQDAHAVIYDELHVAPDRELYDTVKWAGAQRSNSLFFQITTAGFDKTSICWDRHEWTRKVNDGIVDDDNFWGVIYAADENDDPWSEKTWKKANPIWDYSDVFREKFRQSAREAQNNVSLENSFKRLRLNIWTSTDEKWISDADWARGNGELINLKGKTCYAGLDLASTADTTALVLVFPVDDVYYVMPFIFVPEEIIKKRERKNETYYLKWEREGHLIRTPGNITDYSYVRKKLNDLKSLYDIKTIGFDPFNALQFITTMAQEDGFEVVEYRQGWQTMSEPTKEFERLLLDGKIRHAAHPVLRWMADNARTIKDSNDNYRVAKGKYSTGKVDGIIASIIAIGECIKHRVEETPIMEVW